MRDGMTIPIFGRHMSNYSNIKNNIRLLISEYYTNYSGLDILVVWNNQNAPRPDLPYISLNILNIGNFGHVDVTTPDANGVFETILTKEFVISIQCYSDSFQFDPMDVLESLIFYLKSSKSDIDLQKLNIVFVENTNVNDISNLIDGNNIEKRSQSDLIFRSNYCIEDNQGLINDVDFVGTYNKT